MKTYDRAELRRTELQQEVREEAAWWARYYDLYDFFYEERDIDVTMDDIYRGKLFTLLIKLGLKTPKEQIVKLRW